VEEFRSGIALDASFTPPPRDGLSAAQLSKPSSPRRWKLQSLRTPELSVCSNGQQNPRMSCHGGLQMGERLLPDGGRARRKTDRAGREIERVADGNVKCRGSALGSHGSQLLSANGNVPFSDLAGPPELPRNRPARCFPCQAAVGLGTSLIERLGQRCGVTLRRLSTPSRVLPGNSLSPPSGQ
jgi:hypothetical protein